MRAEPPDPTTRSHVAAIYAYSAVAAILSLLMWPVAYVLHASMNYHFNGRPVPWLTFHLISERRHLLLLGIGWLLLPFFIARLFGNRPTLVVLFQASVLLLRGPV